MKKLSKNICLTALIILVGGLVIFCIIEQEASNSLREQNQALQKQLEGRTSEAEALPNPPAQVSVARHTPDDHLAELLKLRNEVAMLRRQTNTPKVLEHTRIEANVGVTYDPAVWKPSSSIQGSEVHTTTWTNLDDGSVQISLESRSTQGSEGDFKRDLLAAQEHRGDPAELIREGRQSFGGRDWLVLEFRNSNFRPPRSEIFYFLSTDYFGQVRVFIVGDEANVCARQEAIQTFLNQVYVK